MSGDFSGEKLPAHHENIRTRCGYTFAGEPLSPRAAVQFTSAALVEWRGVARTRNQAAFAKAIGKRRIRLGRACASLQKDLAGLWLRGTPSTPINIATIRVMPP